MLTGEAQTALADQLSVGISRRGRVFPIIPGKQDAGPSEVTFLRLAEIWPNRLLPQAMLWVGDPTLTGNSTLGIPRSAKEFPVPTPRRGAVETAGH